jgi:DNA polymerase I
MALLDDNPSFIGIDVETTMNGNEDVGLSNPMHPNNKVVAFGLAIGNYDGTPNTTRDAKVFEAMAVHIPPKDTFCGHNFSFDLLYLYKTSPKLKGLFQKHKIWCTQLAEYIITGQRTKFASLNELATKYGLDMKDDKVSEYFKAGMGADKIPDELLRPYLEHDVKLATIIAQKQWEFAKAAGQLPLILSQMEALHASTEMTFNGLRIDTKRLEEYTVEVVNSYVAARLDLEERVVGMVEDINSPTQWSKFFFGGTKKIKVKEEVGVYKNGNTKYKLAEKLVAIPARIKYVPDPEKVSEKTKQVSVDEDVLKDMLLHTVDAELILIISTLLKYRELSKQLSTYVQGLSKHILNGRIHGSLNHSATVTGRLSSTKPNLQNISNNPIKSIFTSRWEGGYIVEVDFNQLEVAALAHVTRDKQLILDISSGTDIHSALYKSMFGRLPTKDERKPFKARTFQLIYGAGARAIAKQAGCTLDEAKTFIDVFYTRYPMVKGWHDTFSREVETNAKHLIGDDGLLERNKTYVHKTDTGRKFVFKEYYNTSAWSSKMYNFSPTELKNWAVQGLATGDIVPHMLGVLFRKLIGRDDVLMVNTIHDSILFDVKADSVVDFLLEVTDTLKDTHLYFEETFKHPLALKLNAGASYGINWFNMTEASI